MSLVGEEFPEQVFQDLVTGIINGDYAGIVPSWMRSRGRVNVYIADGVGEPMSVEEGNFIRDALSYIEATTFSESTNSKTVNFRENSRLYKYGLYFTKRGNPGAKRISFSGKNQLFTISTGEHGGDAVTEYEKAGYLWGICSAMGLNEPYGDHNHPSFTWANSVMSYNPAISPISYKLTPADHSALEVMGYSYFDPFQNAFPLVSPYGSPWRNLTS